MTHLHASGSPIRVPPDRRPCAPPRGLSRLAAPFVGSLRQGIRRAPVVSCRPLRAGATLSCHIGTPRNIVLGDRRRSTICIKDASHVKYPVPNSGMKMVCRRSRQPPGSLPWLRAMRLSRYAGRRPGGRTPRGFAVARGFGRGSAGSTSAGSNSGNSLWKMVLVSLRSLVSLERR